MSIIENGRETMDQTPVSYPLHFTRPTPLHIRIRDLILAQLEESKSYNQVDSFDEANDFEIDDDDDLIDSPYTMEDDFDHMEDPKWKGVQGETTPDEGVPPSLGAENKEGSE